MSREEFFDRTTPGRRLFIDQCQSEAGMESLYLSADEWAEDVAASHIASGWPEKEAREYAAHDVMRWLAAAGEDMTSAMGRSETLRSSGMV